MFFLGGGKCPNLGVVNVRILGVVNVLLANDSQSNAIARGTAYLNKNNELKQANAKVKCGQTVPICQQIVKMLLWSCCQAVSFHQHTHQYRLQYHINNSISQNHNKQVTDKGRHLDNDRQSGFSCNFECIRYIHIYGQH